MKKIVLFILVSVLLLAKVGAYPFSIEGTITDGFGNPVVGQEVTIYSLSLNQPEKTFTNINGQYSEQFNIPGGFYPDFYVQTWGWCDEVFSSHIETVTGFNGTSQVDFQMCQQVNVPDWCIANFQIENLNNHAFGFINTSLGDIDSLVWDFGNGDSSTEINSTYNFPQHGLFKVCLTIYTGWACMDQTCQTLPVGPWNSASGQVEMNNLSLPDGQLYVYQITGNYGETVWTYKVDIIDGSFSVPYLFYPGYFLQAIPQFNISGPYFPKYLPTYFGQALSWLGADSIDLSGPPPFLQIDLLSYNEMVYGHGSICGELVRFDSVPVGQGPPWLTDNLVAPVSIFLLDENETALDFRIFEEGASFCFEDLPFGNYILRTEKFRVAPFDVAVSISEETPNENDIEIQVHPSSFQIGIEELSTHESVIEVFPNPVNDYLSIKLQHPDYYLIELFDVSGKLIYKTELDGSDHSKLNFNEFKNGIYFLQLTKKDGEAFYKKIQKIE